MSNKHNLFKVAGRGDRIRSQTPPFLPVGNKMPRLTFIIWDISESSGNLYTINNAVDLTYGIGMDVNLYGHRSRQLRFQWNHYEYDGVFINNSDTL